MTARPVRDCYPPEAIEALRKVLDAYERNYMRNDAHPKVLEEVEVMNLATQARKWWAPL